jgi:uncharacterized membrane protein (UPF0127 family)
MKKILALIIALFFAGLHGEESQPPQYWPLQIGNMFFPRIELALTEEEHQSGLMKRKTLEEDQGMLFIRKQPEIMSFWMKNTLIPLDIIFLEENGTIVKIWQMPVEEPQKPGESLAAYHRRLPTYSSEKPASFAIEFKAGISETLQLEIGDKINLETELLRKLLDKYK